MIRPTLKSERGAFTALQERRFLFSLEACLAVLSVRAMRARAPALLCWRRISSPNHDAQAGRLLYAVDRFSVERSQS
jgi:hypothetical protein